MVERAREERRERVVHDDRDAALVRDRGDRLEVRDLELRVADDLEIDGFVFPSIQGMKLDGSDESTNRTSIPSFGRLWRKRFHVPP
jgi:hypothetical protein